MEGSGILYVLDPNAQKCDKRIVGGKAVNLWHLGKKLEDFEKSAAVKVPHWFALTTEAFSLFVKENNLEQVLKLHSLKDVSSTSMNIKSLLMKGEIPEPVLILLKDYLSKPPFNESYVAVRSSGVDEDSSDHSFAGQYDTFLYQSGISQIVEAIKLCWCSCFSERVLNHRLSHDLPISDLNMGVIVQVMVNSESSGVAFSRHPLKPISSNSVYVEAVYGLGEGLVSGELEADRYEVHRVSLELSVEVVKKSEKLVQNDNGGTIKVNVEDQYVQEKALSVDQARLIAHLAMFLEQYFSLPQDIEWAIEKGMLYALQTRPIVTLPPTPFYDMLVSGSEVILWDNSNIVESYSGTTTPLTFSFICYAYEKAYTLTLTKGGVPPDIIESHRKYLANLLGYIRGNVYYNLINWYRMLSCFPIKNTESFMETMMGVKQTLDADVAKQLGIINDSAPQYSIWVKVKLLMSTIYRMYFIDSFVISFFKRFNHYYEAALHTDFESMSLPEQTDYVKMLFKEVLGHWEPTIYNDVYVMLFFGLLKKMVANIKSDKAQVATLQNDVLCGQGGVESTEPTKMLMRIAEYIDTGSDELRQWFMLEKDDVLELLLHQKKISPLTTDNSQSGLRRRYTKTKPAESQKSQVIDSLHNEKLAVVQSINTFIAKYGFRCPNELKLEEATLHDNPEFVLTTLSGYISTKSYSVEDMEQHEQSIKLEAEDIIYKSLTWSKKLLFNWVLFHARKGIKNRENMRFARTKLWGILRIIFRAIGSNMHKLGVLSCSKDIFYLKMEEIFAFVDGRSIVLNIKDLVSLRKQELNTFTKGMPPPERFITKGTASTYFKYPQILDDLDQLKELEDESSKDPFTLKGVSCCPGIVEGSVLVVNSVDEAKDLNGEILITARTDPGWVPLYPLCSGLIIERGSLLSHSAVVARELGLPTIVSVSGGLMRKIKTGMKVKMDGGKGIVEILHD